MHASTSPSQSGMLQNERDDIAPTFVPDDLCAQTHVAHYGPVWSVAFSQDGQRVATGSLDDWLRVWDSKSGQLLMRRRHAGLWQLAFSADASH